MSPNPSIMDSQDMPHQPPEGSELDKIAEAFGDAMAANIKRKPVRTTP